MSYIPQFTISSALLTRVEAITALRERIQGASVQVAWIPALQKDTRIRNAHSSTAIEGNPLTMEEVRALEEGAPLPVPPRSQREIVNYFVAQRYIEKNARRARFTHEHVLQLHALMAGEVMDQGDAGRYRTIRVRVGTYFPPPPEEVSPLMFELLEWWSTAALELSPILSSAILHYRFEAIHPFADGNGRTGRALALWELYRRGFDTHHIFSVDEYYWEDRPRYYAALQAVRQQGGDLSNWLEYCAEGFEQTLQRVWQRIQQLAAGKGGAKVVLRPRQERLLNLLRERGSLSPREVWDNLKISRQGALNLVEPLLKAGLIKKLGTHKNSRYVLK